MVVVAGECSRALSAMGKPELLALAKAHGISVRGSKAAVVTRMITAEVRVTLEIQIP
jgi:hypothetical protein